MRFIRFTMFTVLAIAGTALFAANRPELPKETELAKMAESATSAADHAAVAKAYRLRAESFHQTAEKHEAEVARKANGPTIGMAAKWPAMSRNSVQREKRRAVEARRAALECEQLAILHTQLAVEKGFGGDTEAANTGGSSTSTSRDGSR